MTFSPPFISLDPPILGKSASCLFPEASLSLFFFFSFQMVNYTARQYLVAASERRLLPDSTIFFCLTYCGPQIEVG